MPVLSNRLVEVIWRLESGIALDRSLTEKEMLTLSLVVLKYRRDHGYPPDDYDVKNEAKLGLPITTEEIEAAGAVMYDHTVLLGMNLDELDAAMAGKPIEPESHIPSGDLPSVFKPKLRGYHYCPSMCAYKCGPTIKQVHVPDNTSQIDSSSYALSLEFYSGSDAMDPFERLVYNAITGKEPNISAIVDAVCMYLEWDDEDAFYRELLALYLIDYALRWLTFHS